MDFNKVFGSVIEKYKEQIVFNEAKTYLQNHGYKLVLSETPIANFEDTESKEFLLEVIDNLEEHGYIKKTDIDKLDGKLGYVWNQLNKIAKSFNITRILEYLKKIGIYKYAIA